jgi:transposase
MDKIECRAVIKFFVKEGLTPNEINLKSIKVYGDSSPSFSTIKIWGVEFKRGRTSLENDPREGRPKSATPPEIIEQVHDMVLDDRRMKVREISETIGISYTANRRRSSNILERDSTYRNGAGYQTPVVCDVTLSNGEEPGTFRWNVGLRKDVSY